MNEQDLWSSLYNQAKKAWIELSENGHNNIHVSFSLLQYNLKG